MKTKPEYKYKEQGLRIYTARSRLGFSQEQVAEEMGVTYQSVQQWESGKATPRGYRLEKLANLLKTNVSWITTGQDSDTLLNKRGESIKSLAEELGQQILGADKDVQQAIMALMSRYDSDKASGSEIAKAIKTLLGVK